MTDFRVDDDRLIVSRSGEGAAALEMPSICLVLGDDGSCVTIPIDGSEQRGDALVLRGAAGDFAAEAVWRPAGEATRYVEAELTVRFLGSAPRRAGLRLLADVPDAPDPRWLIPGLFYGENRRFDNGRLYPRWDPGGDDPYELVSPWWSFRADRTALPAVFVRSERACVALWADEIGPLGEQGLGFSGRGAGRSIWIDAPFREEPAVYRRPAKAAPPSVRYGAWQPAEAATLRVRAYAGPPAAHAYDALLREAYTRLRAANPLRPWMSPAEAAELAAHGLMRWHYRAEHAALFETAAFDREAVGEAGDRPNMHVAWISGAPWAAALLAYGRREQRAAEIAAATAVLDKISSGLAPCGAFWGEWRLDRGWSHGWNRGGSLHARTVAEATLFMLRALAAERAHGVDHPGWESAVRSNLQFVVARQRQDGNCGAYYDPHTGDVVGWHGAAGLGWVPALAEGGQLLEEPGWLEAAQRAGEYYAQFVDDELIYGAPEDVHLTPTSEDGYQAVIAYVVLHRATGERRWLDLARRAADWTFTFRYAYNVHFPPNTMLAAYDFRTRGGDQASPSNQHLHAYGLICLPEMLALWRATGDDHYVQRTRDNLACFLQFVARRDGDFNARRGMVSERFYQTDWGQAKGMLLGLSHAWSAGAVLYGSLAAMDDAEAFPAGWANA